jgi:hypothetical protein
MSRRHVAVVLAGLLVAGASIAGPSIAGRPQSASAEVPPPSRRVYMITDSVGLGAKNAMATAFGPGWEFTLDGDAGEFTETLESKYVARG